MSNLNCPSCYILSLPLLYCLTLPQRAWLHPLCNCHRSGCRLQLGPPYSLCRTKQAQISQSPLLGHVLLASDHLSSLSSFLTILLDFRCSELDTALLVQPLRRVITSPKGKERGEGVRPHSSECNPKPGLSNLQCSNWIYKSCVLQI